MLWSGVCLYYYHTLDSDQNLSKSAADYDEALSVVISNLQFDNHKFQGAIDTFNDADPDILIVLELTPEWKDQLKEHLTGYHFEYLIPREDPFGMGIFSKYPIGSHKIYHIYNDTPTLQCRLEFNDTDCELWILHPRPPAPGDAETSEPLDYEFRKVSDLIDGSVQPTIVAGDLNEVAWSRTTLGFLIKGQSQGHSQGARNCPYVSDLCALDGVSSRPGICI